jgi:hypothetical protein
MFKFIKKLSFFVLPFLCLFCINFLFYTNEQGDLQRIGYIYRLESFKNKFLLFPKHTKNEIGFKGIEINNFDFNNINNKKIILVFGDSFSKLKSGNYTDYMSLDSNYLIVNVDYEFNKISQLQTLNDLINSDFFDKVKVHFIILQSVERHFVERFEIIDSFTKINYNEFNSQISEIALKRNSDSEFKHNNLDFFSNTLYLIPYVNFMYTFQTKPCGSQTYKVSLISNPFENHSNQLLFYEKDIIKLSSNNDSIKLIKANNNLNYISHKLRQKNIPLIVFPAPDKYSIFYDKIIGKEFYPRPLFFNRYNSLEKKYIYINTFDILTNLVSKKKDVYFFYDSHWSTSTSKMFSDSILNLIK